MTRPATSPDDQQFHVHLRPQDVGRYVLLPGDPARSAEIAKRFDEPRHIAQHREFNTYTGRLAGATVSVTSTGIGGPSTAIAVEELAKVGADTFIRVGTSGSLQRFIEPGDLGIISAAIRDEGTSAHYMPLAFPAVADPDVTRALRIGARRVGVRHHIGVAHSKGSFYGQHEPQRMPVARELTERWRAWQAAGAICSEMEAATLYVVASVLGVRAGGIMLIAGHPDMTPMTPQERSNVSLDRLIEAAIAGLSVLIRHDRTRRDVSRGPGDDRPRH